MNRICLVNGNHTPGSEWERACPLRNAAARSERARRAARTRLARVTETPSEPVSEGTRYPPTGVAGDGYEEACEIAGLGEGFLSPENASNRPADQGRHGRKGGRPRKHTDDADAHREAQRAYRQRRRPQQGGADAEGGQP